MRVRMYVQQCEQLCAHAGMLYNGRITTLQISTRSGMHGSAQKYLQCKNLMMTRVVLYMGSILCMRAKRPLLARDDFNAKLHSSISVVADTDKTEYIH